MKDLITKLFWDDLWSKLMSVAITVAILQGILYYLSEAPWHIVAMGSLIVWSIWSLVCILMRFFSRFL